MRRTRLFLGMAAMALAAVSGPARAAGASPCANPDTTIWADPTTRTGALACGNPSTVTAGILGYMGIPYTAEQPAGPNRWRVMRPAAWPPAKAPVQATAAGAICPQVDINTLKPTGDEACLFANVYAPATAINGGGALPVMLYIHGGSFTAGDGSDAMFDGSALAAKGVVVVTINYRLGSLGFLATDGIPSGDGTAPVSLNGNFGLLDQQAALRWVHGAIAAFGGDPNRVTLFGESAGAMSVGLHMFSMPSSNPLPTAREPSLFQAAIMESNPLGLSYPRLPDAQATGWNYIAQLCAFEGKTAADCAPTYAWMNSLPAATYVAVDGRFDGSAPPGWIWPDRAIQPHAPSGLRLGDPVQYSLPQSPNIDGVVVHAPPAAGYAPGTRPLPYALGTNRNEGALFAGTLVTGVGPEAPREYTERLKAAFPDNWKQVLAYRTHQGEHPYLATKPNVKPQVGRLFEDFVFQCGNRWLERQTTDTAFGGPYAYHFTQPPIYNMYQFGGRALPACQPASGNVCHGNELPYVFGTIAATVLRFTGKPLPPNSPDQALADAMTTAWAGFARSPLSPPPPWVSVNTGKLVQWNNATVPYAQARNQRLATIGAQSHCAFWEGEDLYPGTSRLAAKTK